MRPSGGSDAKRRRKPLAEPARHGRGQGRPGALRRGHADVRRIYYARFHILALDFTRIQSIVVGVYLIALYLAARGVRLVRGAVQRLEAGPTA
jgi:hypothetical protein